MTKIKEYIRDGRAPIPKKQATSKVMSANKGKNTKPELLLRKELWKNNIRGYRLHWKKVPGNPDISFPGRKLAIFVNGCYWHRCTICNLPLPESNNEFWTKKFQKNVERDKIKIDQLERTGWNTITIWECQINDSVKKCVERIRAFLMKN